MKSSQPSDIEDYISELFAERWRHHDRAILRHTLIGMVGGQVVNARSLSTKYSIPESKVLSEENASLGSRQASPAVQLSVQELSGVAQSLPDTLWP